MQITARYPVVYVTNGEYAAAIIGGPTAEVGDKVNVLDTFNRRRIDEVYVVSVKTFEANEVTPEILDLFDLRTVGRFVTGLGKSYGTGLPRDVTVTVYRFSPRPPNVSGETALFIINDPDDED